MSKLLKLIQKVLDGRDISYEEAEAILLRLQFEIDIICKKYFNQTTTSTFAVSDQGNKRGIKRSWLLKKMLNII